MKPRTFFCPPPQWDSNGGSLLIEYSRRDDSRRKTGLRLHDAIRRSRSLTVLADRSPVGYDAIRMQLSIYLFNPRDFSYETQMVSRARISEHQGLGSCECR